MKSPTLVRLALEAMLQRYELNRVYRRDLIDVDATTCPRLAAGAET